MIIFRAMQRKEKYLAYNLCKPVTSYIHAPAVWCQGKYFSSNFTSLCEFGGDHAIIYIKAIIFRFARDRTEFFTTKLSQMIQHNVTITVFPQNPVFPCFFWRWIWGKWICTGGLLSLNAVFFPRLLYPLVPFGFLLELQSCPRWVQSTTLSLLKRIHTRFFESSWFNLTFLC